MDISDILGASFTLYIFVWVYGDIFKTEGVNQEDWLKREAKSEKRKDIRVGQRNVPTIAKFVRYPISRVHQEFTDNEDNEGERLSCDTERSIVKFLLVSRMVNE